MLQAVQIVHDEKIVHSDLKPANFVLVKGQLKLIDFGIAYQEELCAAPENLWPEKRDGMYNDVATGCVLF